MSWLCLRIRYISIRRIDFPKMKTDALEFDCSLVTFLQGKNTIVNISCFTVWHSFERIVFIVMKDQQKFVVLVAFYRTFLPISIWWYFCSFVFVVPVCKIFLIVLLPSFIQCQKFRRSCFLYPHPFKELYFGFFYISLLCSVLMVHDSIICLYDCS